MRWVTPRKSRGSAPGTGGPHELPWQRGVVGVDLDAAEVLAQLFVQQPEGLLDWDGSEFPPQLGAEAAHEGHTLHPPAVRVPLGRYPQHGRVLARQPIPEAPRRGVAVAGDLQVGRLNDHLTRLAPLPAAEQEYRQVRRLEGLVQAHRLRRRVAGRGVEVPGHGFTGPIRRGGRSRPVGHGDGAGQAGEIGAVPP